MGTSRDDIRRWLKAGKEKGATHMLVICDSFDYEDYPVYVMPDEDANEVRQEKCKSDNMQRLMECYSYTLDLEEQVMKNRVYNFD